MIWSKPLAPNTKEAPALPVGTKFVLPESPLTRELTPGEVFTLDRSESGRPDLRLMVEEKSIEGVAICRVVDASATDLTIRCVHFGGLDLQTFKLHCEAGQTIERGGAGKTIGQGGAFPCVGSRVVPHCPARVWKSIDQTIAEVAASKKRAEESAAKMKKVFDVLPKIGWGESVEIACPVCAGKLHYARAASNGHERGACETEGCVQWLQ